MVVLLLSSNILERARRMDCETRPNVDEMDAQPQMRWPARPCQLDFPIEMHSASQISTTALFLTIKLLDRYCSEGIVFKRYYQMVGCAALLVASKYGAEKWNVPTIKMLESQCFSSVLPSSCKWSVVCFPKLGWTIRHATFDALLKMVTEGQATDLEIEYTSLYIYLRQTAHNHCEFVSK